jgi:cell division protein FtsW (lipid II flippase)
LGVAVLLFAEFAINIGMNIGFFPVTGIGLPFMSYGGSSLLVHLALVGVVMSVALREPAG